MDNSFNKTKKAVTASVYRGRYLWKRICVIDSTKLSGSGLEVQKKGTVENGAETWSWNLDKIQSRYWGENAWTQSFTPNPYMKLGIFLKRPTNLKGKKKKKKDFHILVFKTSGWWLDSPIMMPHILQAQLMHMKAF